MPTTATPEVARADLGDLNAAVQEPATAGVHPVSEPGSATLRQPVVETREAPVQARVVPIVAPIVAPAAIDSEELYPGDALDPRHWSNPLAYEPMSYIEEALLTGFTPVELDDLAYDGIYPAATRLMVPSIGIDSSVDELEILELGGSRAYETPSNTIGHIPETANAGERGSSWFFGHTESPIGGEGSVFFNLGDIAEKLRNGEEVFIVGRQWWTAVPVPGHVIRGCPPGRLEPVRYRGGYNPPGVVCPSLGIRPPAGNNRGAGRPED